MKRHIIHDSKPIGLIGAGNLRNTAIKAALSHCDKMVAADGGARAALDHGVMPDAVIGDFDSIDGATRAELGAGRLYPDPDQETTDFEKCLTSIAAPLVLGVGFMGGRTDHELAAMSVLMSQPTRRCILLGAEDLVLLAPPALSLNLALGSRLSLFPLAPVTGEDSGLRWPIKGLDLRPGGRIGTSNAVSGPVRLTFDRPAMLLILPLVALDEVIRQLLQQPAGWPVRAK